MPIEQSYESEDPWEGDLKAAAFQYAKAASVAEAIALKARHGDGARFLAGGQSLLAAMNLRLDRPDLVIDIDGIGDLRAIGHEAGVVHIGALATTDAIGRSEVIARHAPLLGACVEHIAHPAIRTRSTIGGSVALADPAAEWPAACRALDATIVAVGPDGERRLPAADFFLGLYQTALLTDELIVRFEVPAAGPGTRVAAEELARRRGDFAIAGVLAQASGDGKGGLADVRTAIFGVADRPVRIPAVEAALTGSPDMAAVKAALALHLECTGDLYHAPATKAHLVGVLFERAAEKLVATGGAP